MSEQQVLELETRTGMGSHAVKKYRRQGMAPGIIYGHGDESLPVLTNAHTFRKVVAVGQYGSQVVKLNLDGREAGSALVKGVQINTVSRQILNIDFMRVSSEDRVNVSVSVVVEGESLNARTGAVVEQLFHSVSLRCSAFEVPTQITIDVSQMQIGDSVHAGQLPLPSGAELHQSADDVILLVAPPTKVAVEEPVEVEALSTEEGGVGPALTGEKQTEDTPS